MRNLFPFEIGDAEVREITFSIDAVVLAFFLPSSKQLIKALFSEVEYFAIESNLMQNVVESARLYERRELERNVFSSDLVSKYISLTGERRNCDKKQKHVYISPIAGAEALIVCGNYKIEGCKT